MDGNSRYNMTVNDIRIKLYPRYLKSKDELTIESEDLKDLNMHVASSQSLGLENLLTDSITIKKVLSKGVHEFVFKLGAV